VEENGHFGVAKDEEWLEKTPGTETNGV
jgi:hypothetical protein